MTNPKQSIDNLFLLAARFEVFGEVRNNTLKMVELAVIVIIYATDDAI